jgi:acyl carrier protein
MNEQIRDVIAQHGRLPVGVDSIGPDDDLYEAGMTSHASVTVMLALEEAFDVEFPDAMLSRGTFSSVQAIATALAQLIGSASV